MVRAFRFDEPMPARPTIARPLLVARLEERWERRVVTVVAGAGFGKSTLVAAALRANRDDPRGDDHWLGLDPGDNDGIRLGRDLLRSLGSTTAGDVEPVDAPSIEALAHSIAETIWDRSPRAVALVLDDVHELDPASTGARLLDELVRSLPGNGHVVLVSRTDPPVALARLRAHGHVTTIGADLMAFADDEIERFAALRAVDVDRLDDLGGWPALIELRADTAVPGTHDFIVEEVFAARRPDEIAIVETLALIGEADHSLLSALGGRDIGRDELASLMATVPLSVSNDGGTWGLHRLWSDAVAERVEPMRRRRILADAASALVERDPVRAIELAVRCDAHATTRRALREVLSTPWAQLHRGEAGDLYRQLPATLTDSGEARLLLASDVSTSSPIEAQQILRSVTDEASRAGDHVLATLAVERLVIIASRRQEPFELVDAFERVVAVVDAVGTGERSTALLVLRDALSADARGDARAVLAALDRLPTDGLDAYWRAPIAWMRAQATLALGFPDAALGHSEMALRLAPPALRAELTMLHVNALVLDGRPAEALEVLGPMVHLLDELGTTEARALGHGQMAQRLAHHGHVDAARRELALAVELAGPEPVGPLRMNSNTAEALVAIAEGDEGRAIALVGDGLRDVPLAGGRQLYAYRRRLAIVYVLAPATRHFWDDTELGPAYVLQRDLARALVDARRSDARAAQQLSSEHWTMAQATLPLPWLCELAITASGLANDDAERVLKSLEPMTSLPALRAIAERSSGNQKRRARAVLAAMPAVPPHALTIDALGPLTLRRDETVVADSTWRRERVRSLLGYLICRRRCTRDEAATALWPDLDDIAASRNLRVTLSYLQKVLEPQRESGQPGYYLRSDGSRLELGGRERLGVDVDLFEASIDAAAAHARTRSPADELGCLSVAVEAYRGPFLADLRAEEWLIETRNRLTIRYVTAAVRAGELSRAHGDLDAALALGERAIVAEPWSEAARRLLVAVHLDRGDRASARRSLRACLGMLDEMGVSPEPETRDLARRLA